MKTPRPPKGFKIVHVPDATVLNDDVFWDGDQWVKTELSSGCEFKIWFFYARRIRKKSRRKSR